jgi:hypothetical protein
VSRDLSFARIQNSIFQGGYRYDCLVNLVL